MKSKFLSVDSRDIMKGIFIAFVTSVLAGIQKIFETGAGFDWPTFKPVLIAGICAAISYILKNLVSNSRDQLFTKEPL
jgi:hypothetical protein